MANGFDVFRVSNLVIDTAKESNIELTSLKLQKILFILQGFYLYKYKARLIDGNFAKWQFGPTEKESYNYFKSYDSAEITDEAFDFSTETFEITPIPPISADDIGSDRFADLKFELTKLLSILTWKLIELTRNDASWSNYEEEIRTYSAGDYADQEIKICYIYCFELQD
ncbi:Panacea domain-containing protein [Lactobacillus delbrueckii]|uniref:Panacea domain-containing protein n=1 Tax=Lactobacillus delbrueckii TaxID=1584 RepID=UPI0015932ED6|nr:type II toxin-antitoxin system antitoxin SocA domain-containing protein [Lactobacillus delbrueckii]MDA3849379.1 DUF4065 domain-containing protein [Lactobacillus delbrueckii]NVH29908.1 DUF4065 domain-containing protein [Lactobacillus delbrueckii subsp. bulgaricus]NWO31838.1 DUF4065 domain-containing protein [Lactobacillus delbrueckii subsp. bulgaricus]